MLLQHVLYLHHMLLFVAQLSAYIKARNVSYEEEKGELDGAKCQQDVLAISKDQHMKHQQSCVTVAFALLPLFHNW